MAHTLKRRNNAFSSMHQRHEMNDEVPITDDESSSSSSSSLIIDAPNKNSQGGGNSLVNPINNNSNSNSNSNSNNFLPWMGIIIWPLMLFLPLVLNHSTKFHYTTIFPRGWYTLHGEEWLNKSLEVGGI